MPSSTNVPSSTSSAIRSRAVSLSRSCCLAIFSSPPPSAAIRRRSCRSSTSGRSIEVGASVADIRSFLEGIEKGLDHAQDRGRAEGPLELVDGGLEVGDLEADHLAAGGDAAQQGAELGDLEPAGGRELDGQLALGQDVEVEVHVDRVAAQRFE